MLSEEQFQSLVLKVHEAAIDPSQWDVMTKSVADAFGATTAVLLTPGEIDTHERFLWSCHGVDPQAQIEYGPRWVAEDVWLSAMQRSRVSMARGAFHIADEYLPRTELLGTTFYNEFLAPYEMEGHATIFIEEKDRDAAVPVTQLSLLRAPGMASFTAEELRPFRALHLHLHQALRTHWLLASTRKKAFQDALDTSAHAIFLVSSEAEIQYANLAAERTIRSPVISDVRNGVLRGVGRMEPGALNSAVQLAAKGTGQSLTTWWPAAEARFVTATVRLTRIEASARFDATGLKALVLVTVEVQDPSVRIRAIQQAAAQKFRLTPAEIRVLDAVMHGVTAEVYAAEQGVQVSTVRTHLASLLRKTGCRRQSDLLRLDDRSG